MKDLSPYLVTAIVLCPVLLLAIFCMSCSEKPIASLKDNFTQIANDCKKGIYKLYDSVKIEDVSFSGPEGCIIKDFPDLHISIALIPCRVTTSQVADSQKYIIVSDGFTFALKRKGKHSWFGLGAYYPENDEVAAFNWFIEKFEKGIKERNF